MQAADADPGSLTCSRNSENMTRKYPDLAARVPQLLKEGVQDVVLDCECVAYDRETKTIMPFQVCLMLRSEEELGLPAACCLDMAAMTSMPFQVSLRPDCPEATDASRQMAAPSFQVPPRLPRQAC